MSIVRRIKDLVNGLADSPVDAVNALPRAMKGVKRAARRERYQARLRSGDVDFVTTDELATWTRAFVGELPGNYDAVIGVPRSGMLVASMIATQLGRPLTTPDLFVEGRFWSSRLLDAPAPERIQRVLLVDDSVDRGSSLDAARAVVERRSLPVQITTAAVIAHRTEAGDLIDHFHRIVPHPTIFEWNLMHAKVMSRLSASFEGVLDRIGRIPAYPVDLVLAAGGESDRNKTVATLDAKGARFVDLVMLAGRDKAEILMSASPDLHLEASLDEARRVEERTGIPTLSLDAMQLVGSLR